MTGTRWQNDGKNNVNIEALSRQISSVRQELNNQALKLTQMSGSMLGTITQPIPSIPFKIFERAEDGKIYVTVTGQCPQNTEEIDITLLRKSRNQILLDHNGDPKETIEEAKARAKAEALGSTYKVPVSEDQAAVQIFTVEIGPLKPKDGDDNKYQLIRLRVFDGKGAFAKNPVINPFRSAAMINPPTPPTAALAGAGAGLLSAGSYRYVFTYLDNFNNETTPSVASNIVVVVTPGTNGKVNVTIPKGPANKTKARKLYRTVANGADFKLIDTVLNNTDTLFLDNKADVALGIPPPTENATMGFPYPALTVAVDDGMTTEDESKFFTIGSSISSAPSPPSLADIVCNRVDLDTPVPDGTITVRVRASGADPTLNFGEVGIQKVASVFRLTTDPAIPGSPTSNQDAPIKLEGDITDLLATEILLQGSFALGQQFTWVRNIAFNSTGQEKAVAVGINFYAGGDIVLTRLVAAYSALSGASADGRIRVIVQLETPTSSTVYCYFTQPAAGVDPCAPLTQAVIFRKIRFLRQKADGTWVNKNTFNALLDETAFTPGEHFATFEFNHKANRTDINFRCELISLGLPVTKITAESNGNSSVLNASPLDPILAEVSTGPDGDTDAADAFVDIEIPTGLLARNLDVAAPKFSDLGIEQVFVAMKRIKNSNDPNDVTSSDTKFTHYGGPVPSEDIGATKTILHIPGLKLGRKYRIRRTIFLGGGSSVQSPGAVPFEFIAGLGLLDLTTLILYAPTVSANDKNSSEVTCQFDQPQAGQPILLKNLILLRHNPNKTEKITQVGAGLNDITTGGVYTVIPSHTYIIKITATGSPNQFSVTKDNVLITSNVAITGAFQAVGTDGVTIKFNSTTGHTLNNTFTFTAMFREFDPFVLRTTPEYSDNNSGTPPATDPVFLYRKYVSFEVAHKPMQNNIQYAFRIRAIGNATKESAITNANTAGDTPAFSGAVVPPIPALADLVINQPNGDPAMAGAQVVVRFYASDFRNQGGHGGSAMGTTLPTSGTVLAGAINFDDIGADSYEVVITLTSDTTRKITPNGVIDDTTLTSIDVSVAGLTFGEQYTVRRYIVSKSGFKAAMPGTFNFRAGGDTDLTGVSVSIVGVFLQDVHNSIVTAKVQQPNGRVVLFKNLQIFRNVNGAGFTEIANSRVILRDDADLYAAPSTPGAMKTFDLLVPHKKNVNIVYRIVLQGVKGATGGSGGSDKITIDSASGNTGDEPTFVDTARPAYTSPKTPNLKFKWALTGIRVKFRPPDLNMNTHESNRLEIFIAVTDPVNGNTQYFLDPADSTVFLQGLFNFAFPDEPYTSNVDKTSNNFFVYDRPDQDTTFGDVDPSIVNRIRTAINNGGFADLNCMIYIFNRFVPPIGQLNYCTITSGIIRWDSTTRKWSGKVSQISFG